MRPFAAASSAHTRPLGWPAENTGTVSHPARDGAKGAGAGAGAVSGTLGGAATARAVAGGLAAAEPSLSPR